MPHREYDSEGEDSPRRVLDTNGDFRVLGADPDYTFKLHDFRPMVEDKNGNMIPFPGVISVRPVPSPAIVQRARAAMGNGTNGVWVSTVFTPEAGEPPSSMFAVRHVNTATPGRTIARLVLRRRYVPRIGGLKTMLLMTDGSCPGNGAADARAGWAFIFGPGSEGSVSGVLEQKGPDGELHVATSNRAELRAVIAALEFRVWWGEGWERIVIATDSEYVANGATAWLRSWADRRWRTSGGSPVQNRDLWEKLSEQMGMLAEQGCEVSFWRVPRAWNTEADQNAKTAAESGKTVVEYEVQQGVLV
ncbi:ribonuclease H-like domain-containing protein [Cercophora newfieldiana]|uniref:ribonuclease H n=1 Tax=Cercophora newfieldiana TaxID=92897 RepID=A0AA39Y5H9_9PEZI|nr:ribonuclease H-like domain-containing protein [Cercophora newfieldiana]